MGEEAIKGAMTWAQIYASIESLRKAIRGLQKRVRKLEEQAKGKEIKSLAG